MRFLVKDLQLWPYHNEIWPECVAGNVGQLLAKL